MTCPIPLPPSQSAPIDSFRIFFTAQKRQKLKKWQDGLLRFHTFNKRMLVYDSTRTFVCDSYLRNGKEKVEEGDEIEFDNHLVTVEEWLGREVQDLRDVVGSASKRKRLELEKVQGGSEIYNSPLVGRFYPKSLKERVLVTGKEGKESGELDTRVPTKRVLDGHTGGDVSGASGLSINAPRLGVGNEIRKESLFAMKTPSKAAATNMNIISSNFQLKTPQLNRPSAAVAPNVVSDDRDLHNFGSRSEKPQKAPNGPRRNSRNDLDRTNPVPNRAIFHPPVPQLRNPSSPLAAPPSPVPEQLSDPAVSLVAVPKRAPFRIPRPAVFPQQAEVRDPSPPALSFHSPSPPHPARNFPKRTPFHPPAQVQRKATPPARRSHSRTPSPPSPIPIPRRVPFQPPSRNNNVKTHATKSHSLVNCNQSVSDNSLDRQDNRIVAGAPPSTDTGQKESDGRRPRLHRMVDDKTKPVTTIKLGGNKRKRSKLMCLGGHDPGGNDENSDNDESLSRPRKRRSGESESRSNRLFTSSASCSPTHSPARAITSSRSSPGLETRTSPTQPQLLSHSPPSSLTRTENCTPFQSQSPRHSPTQQSQSALKMQQEKAAGKAKQGQNRNANEKPLELSGFTSVAKAVTDGTIDLADMRGNNSSLPRVARSKSRSKTTETKKTPPIVRVAKEDELGKATSKSKKGQNAQQNQLSEGMEMTVVQGAEAREGPLGPEKHSRPYKPSSKAKASNPPNSNPPPKAPSTAKGSLKAKGKDTYVDKEKDKDDISAVGGGIETDTYIDAWSREAWELFEWRPPGMEMPIK